MTRRIQGLLLIGILLGGSPLRAAEARSAPTAEIEIDSTSPGRLQAVRARLLSSGACVRWIAAGRGLRLWVSGRSRRALEAALGELAAAAGPVGLKIRILTGGGRELRAVPTKSTSLDASHPGRADAPAAAERFGAVRPATVVRIWPRPRRAPAIGPAAVPSAHGSRGPPA